MPSSYFIIMCYGSTLIRRTTYLRSMASASRLPQGAEGMLPQICHILWQYLVADQTHVSLHSMACASRLPQGGKVMPSSHCMIVYHGSTFIILLADQAYDSLALHGIGIRALVSEGQRGGDLGPQIQEQDEECVEP